MPTFHPQLSHTTVVPVRIVAKDAFIHLSFFLTFAVGEDSSGKWEIWTELPAVDSGAKPLSSDPWQAIPFEVVQVMATPISSADTMANAIVLSTSNHLPVVKHSLGQTYRASVVISTHTDRLYAYTFRRTLNSGELHWLGREGSNGIIKVESGDRVSMSESDSISEADEGSEVEGVRINIRKETGCLSAHLYDGSDSAPSDLSVTSTLLPLHSCPISVILPTVASQPLSRRTVHAASRKYLPEATSSSVGIAVREALALSDGSITSIETDREGILALHHVHPADADTADLLIYAPSSPFDRSVDIALPGHLPLDSPTAVLKGIKLVSLLDQGRSRTLRFMIPRGGTLLQMFLLSNLVGLRSNGQDDPIWICVPEAIRMEVGEEEQEILSNPNDMLCRGEDTIAPTEATPELEDSDVSDDGQHAKGLRQASSQWWILRLVGRFFARFWAMVFAPFGYMTGGFNGEETDNIGSGDVGIIAYGDPRDVQVEDSGDDDEAEERATRTPVDERTPLLKSADISPDTSSTGFSPLASPLAKAISTQPLTLLAINQLVGPKPPISKNAPRVQIRSYVRFTCLSPPSIAYLFAPSFNSMTYKLRASWRVQGEKWKETTVETRASDVNGCLEASFDFGPLAAEMFELQVERV